MPPLKSLTISCVTVHEVYTQVLHKTSNFFCEYEVDLQVWCNSFIMNIFRLLNNIHTISLLLCFNLPLLYYIGSILTVCLWTFFIISYIYSINTYSRTRLQQLALFLGHYHFPLFATDCIDPSVKIFYVLCVCGQLGSGLWDTIHSEHIKVMQFQAVIWIFLLLDCWPQMSSIMITHQSDK